MFYIKSACFFISSKWRISLVVLISLVFAYLLPIMLLTGIQAGFEQLRAEEQKDIERVFRYTKTSATYQADFAEVLHGEAEKENKIEAFSCVFSVNTDIVLADTVQRRNVYAIDENYAGFYDWETIIEEGRELGSFEGEKVCLLEEELFLRCKEQKTTEIFINGTAYRLIGAANREGIYVPYASLKGGSSGNSYVFLKLAADAGNLSVSLPSLLGYRMEPESERLELIKSTTIANVRNIGAILAVLFLLVVLNLMAIWREQYMQLQTVLGVQRAVGLSRFGLFLEQAIQNFLLSLGAIAALYFFSPIINWIFAGFGEIRFSLFSLVSMLAAAAVLAALQATVTTVLIYRQSIRMMLEGTL